MKWVEVRIPQTIRIAELLPMHTVTCSHLSCIRQIARKLPRVCQPLDSQLASQTYMYFIIEREHELGYPCFYAIMLGFVAEKLLKLQSGWGSAPDPDGGANSASPYPLAGREGATPPPAPPPHLISSTLLLSRTPLSPDQPTGLQGAPWLWACRIHVCVMPHLGRTINLFARYLFLGRGPPRTLPPRNRCDPVHLQECECVLPSQNHLPHLYRRLILL